jgi:hypothetical protein
MQPFLRVDCLFRRHNLEILHSYHIDKLKKTGVQNLVSGVYFFMGWRITEKLILSTHVPVDTILFLIVNGCQRSQ